MQILAFGASITYGVGGKNGGWVDMLKRKLHDIQYQDGGIGEKHEVHTFALPGATVDFVQGIHEDLIQRYSANGEVISILSIGMNNIKAKGSAENFVSTPEEYTEKMTGLLQSMKEKSDHLICVGYSFVDESKAAPKRNIPPNLDSYFFNDRILQFNNIFRSLCEDMDIPFIDVIESIDEKEWVENYVYRKDGLHPNDKGYTYMFEKVWPEIEKLL